MNVEEIISKIDFDRIDYCSRFHEIILKFTRLSIEDHLSKFEEVLELKSIEYKNDRLGPVLYFNHYDAYDNRNLTLIINWLNSALIDRENEVGKMFETILKDIDPSENDDITIKLMYVMMFDEMTIIDEQIIDNFLRYIRNNNDIEWCWYDWFYIIVTWT